MLFVQHKMLHRLRMTSRGSCIRFSERLRQDWKRRRSEMRENRLRLLEQRPDIGAPVAHPSVQIADQHLQLECQQPANVPRQLAAPCNTESVVGAKPKLQEALSASA